MRLGVIEINTDSKIVNSMVNGFKGSVARNSPTSQDSRLGGTPHNGLYGRPFLGFRYIKDSGIHELKCRKG